jgi:hypothetical protein
MTRPVRATGTRAAAAAPALISAVAMAITRVRARVAVGRRQGTRVEGTRAPWIARRAAWTMSLAA